MTMTTTTAARKAATSAKATLAFALALLMSVALFGCGGLASCSKQPYPTPAEPAITTPRPVSYPADGVWVTPSGALERISGDGTARRMIGETADAVLPNPAEPAVLAYLANPSPKRFAVGQTTAGPTPPTAAAGLVWTRALFALDVAAADQFDSWSAQNEQHYAATGAYWDYSPALANLAQGYANRLAANGYTTDPHRGEVAYIRAAGFDPDTVVFNIYYGYAGEPGCTEAYMGSANHAFWITCAAIIHSASTTAITADGYVWQVSVYQGDIYGDGAIKGEVTDGVSEPPKAEPKSPTTLDPGAGTPDDELVRDRDLGELTGQEPNEAPVTEIGTDHESGVGYQPDVPIDASDLAEVRPAPTPDEAPTIDLSLTINPDVTAPVIVGNDGNGNAVAIRPMPDADDGTTTGGYNYVPGIPGVDGALIPSLPPSIGNGSGDDTPIVGVDQDALDALLAEITAKREAGDFDAADKAADDFIALIGALADKLAEAKASVEAAKAETATARAEKEEADRAAAEQNNNSGSGDNTAPPPSGSSGGGNGGGTVAPPTPTPPPNVVGLFMTEAGNRLSTAGFNVIWIDEPNNGRGEPLTVFSQSWDGQKTVTLVRLVGA